MPLKARAFYFFSSPNVQFLIFMTIIIKFVRDVIRWCNVVRYKCELSPNFCWVQLNQTTITPEHKDCQKRQAERNLACLAHVFSCAKACNAHKCGTALELVIIVVETNNRNTTSELSLIKPSFKSFLKESWDFLAMKLSIGKQLLSNNRRNCRLVSEYD